MTSPFPRLETLLTRHPALAVCRSEISAAFALLEEAFLQDRKLLICGNGGSAADADHWAGELLKGFVHPRPLPACERQGLTERAAEVLQWAFPVIPLTGFPAFASAYANDVAAEFCFAQLVLALGRPGDVLAVLTTSGNSANVLRAAEVARARGVRVLALTGGRGGAVRALAEVCICVPAETTPDVQEFHLPVYHALCLMLEDAFAARM